MKQIRAGWINVMQVTPTLLQCSLRSEHYNRRIFAQVLCNIVICMYSYFIVHSFRVGIEFILYTVFSP